MTTPTAWDTYREQAAREMSRQRDHTPPTPPENKETQTPMAPDKKPPTEKRGPIFDLLEIGPELPPEPEAKRGGPSNLDQVMANLEQIKAKPNTYFQVGQFAGKKTATGIIAKLGEKAEEGALVGEFDLEVRTLPVDAEGRKSYALCAAYLEADE